MAVTIQQIAEMAGVSRGTVDRAINDRGRINPEVAQRIKEIADELGYKPKQKKNLSKDKKRIKIGIITQLSKTAFTKEIRSGIDSSAQMLYGAGVDIIVKEVEAVNEEEQQKCINELLKEDISGLAIMPVESEKIRNCINNMVEELNIPVVTFNSDIVGTKRSCFVGMDNRKSGLTSAGLMGMMTGGEGKVLVITGFFSNNVNSLRVDGFVEEIKKSFPNIELVGVQSSFDDEKEVERIICNTMETFSDLKGIFVVSSGQCGLKIAFEKLEVEKRPFVIIYDTTKKNKKLLLEGNADFLIDQDLYFQGYRPPFILADAILFNKLPESEHIYTNINIKTKYNI